MTSNEPKPEQRRALARKLRQMETIEELMEFDITSLQIYADAVAEERQYLTQQVLAAPSKR